MESVHKTDTKSPSDSVSTPKEREKTKGIVVLGIGLICSFILAIFEYYTKNKLFPYLPCGIFVLALVVSIIMNLVWSNSNLISRLIAFVASLAFVNCIVLVYYKSIGMEIIVSTFLIVCLYSVILNFIFSYALDGLNEAPEVLAIQETFLCFLVTLIPSALLIVISLFFKFTIREEISFSAMAVSFAVTSIYAIHTCLNDSIFKESRSFGQRCLFGLSLTLVLLTTILIGLARALSRQGSIFWQLLCVLPFVLAYLLITAALWVSFGISITKYTTKLEQLKVLIQAKGPFYHKVCLFASLITLGVGVLLLIFAHRKQDSRADPMFIFKIIRPTTLELNEEVINHIINATIINDLIKNPPEANDSNPSINTPPPSSDTTTTPPPPSSDTTTPPPPSSDTTKPPPSATPDTTTTPPPASSDTTTTPPPPGPTTTTTTTTNPPTPTPSTTTATT
ncbi:hypothetical protein NEHOM01_0005 [Nematocida homosporus]|uniref:uncharacterized protein n=1 Tax=Nematocida homosporus TaxID=1912981 RepID=UPI00221F386B|nr:uncharacterized protein NEHOM01_0005 [Nematocida homosporus]KAI5184260.1 hypothetical protein NEHOM01_0005 [Nematocida homosporus]